VELLLNYLLLSLIIIIITISVVTTVVDSVTHTEIVVTLSRNNTAQHGTQKWTCQCHVCN